MSSAREICVGVYAIVYARHGHELMGCESPVGEPAFMGIECGHLAPSEWVHPFNNSIERQLLADGKGDSARDRLKEA